jgi:uncharacterized membrane protein YeaQ/YmgE (transglycosylase-associated protein family)
MNILLWIIFGGLAGWIASLIMGDAASFGIIGNVVIGIIGAFIGGWIADTISVGEGERGADRPTSIWGFVWAVIGAIVLLFLVGLIF